MSNPMSGNSALRKARIIVAAGVVVLAALVGVLYFALRSKTSQGRSTAAMRELAAAIPDDSPLVVTGQYSRDRMSLLELNELVKLQPSLKNELEQKHEKKQAALKAWLGFDPDDEKAWLAAGLDLHQPFSAILTSSDFKHNDVADITTFAVQPVDAANAEKTLRRLWENSTDSQLSEILDQKIAMKHPHSLLAVNSGPRLFVKQRTSAESEQKLRAWLDAAKLRPLSAQPNFVACMNELPAQADYTAFVNIAGVVNAMAEHDRPEFLANIQALGFAGSDEENTGFLLLNNNELLDQLRPGGESREFLARFDPPLAAVSWSLADTAELLRALHRMNSSKDGKDSTKSETERALEAGEYDRFLKDNCGGVLIYPDESKGFIPLSYAVVLKVNDAPGFEAVMAKEREKSKKPPRQETKKEFGKNVVFVDESDGTARATIGEYIIAGNARAQIEALAQGAAKGWHPSIGGKSALEIQVPIAAAMRFALRKENVDVQIACRDKIDAALNFTARVEGRKNGIYYHGDYRGVTAALVKFAAEIKDPSAANSKN